MSSKTQPVRKQKRTAGQAGKAVAAGVLFAAAEELLASKPVVEPQLLPELSDAPASPAVADAQALSAVEAVAVDVPLDGPHAATPAVSSELAELLAELDRDGGGADLAAALDDEPVLLADAGAAAGASDPAVAQVPEAAPAPAPAGAGAEALAPAVETAAPFSVPLAVVGGLGVIGVGAALGGGGGGSRPVATPTPTVTSPPEPTPTVTSSPEPTPAPTHDVTGRVVDGPVQHARVFYDSDGDGVWDDVNGNNQWDPGDELFDFTDDAGNFNIPGITLTANGRLVVEAGGTDSETGNTVGALLAPLLSNDADNLVISPLSLVLALNPTLTQAELKEKLGLPADVDLLTFDPFAAMSAGGAQAGAGVQVYAAQQQLYALVRAVSQASAGADGVVSPAELQAALGAVGSALMATDSLDQAVHSAVAAVVSDAAQANQITQAVQFTSTAIRTAYTATSGGLNLASARALAASGDTSNPDYAEAVRIWNAARATASVSQSTLLSVVSTVQNGGTYNSAVLQSAINNQVEHYQDLTGQLTATQVSSVVAGGDDALDLLVQQLHSAGIEQVSLSAAQVTTLTTAHDDLDFALGTDVVVTGTSFLGAAGVGGGEAVLSLLGAADVAVALTGAEVTAIAGRSDTSLDDLVQKLQAAGMDSLQLSASQLNQLAHTNTELDFEAGTAVDITSNFLGGAADQAELGKLLGAADVTVHLTQQDVDKIVVGGDAALDTAVTALHQAGMDVLALGEHEVATLAHAGLHLATGTDVSVTGTHFLSAGTATDDQLHALLHDANVTVHLTNGDLAQLLAGTTTDDQLDALTAHLHEVGVDALALDAGQALALADATQRFTLNGALDIQLDDALTLTQAASEGEIDALKDLLAGADVTARLDMADLRQLHASSTTALGDDIAAMEAKLDKMGVDHLEISDELADALAEAGVRFMASDDEPVPIVGSDYAGQDVVVRAQADTAGGDTAYLQASLQELQELGVDHVVGAGGVTHIEMALAKAAGTSAFDLNDLPSFRAADNVDLVVTEEDLAALFADTGSLAANLDALHAAHIDQLLVRGADGALSQEQLGQLADVYGAALSEHSLTLDAAHLTNAQVQLLGLDSTAEPANPLDPFNKHPTSTPT